MEFEDILLLFKNINDSTYYGKQAKFLIAFLFLTGIRINALRTLTLDCIDIERGIVYQYPSKGVQTKYNKEFLSLIFNFDQEMYDYVICYLKNLRDNEGFKLEDPVFHQLAIEINDDSTEIEIPVKNKYLKTNKIGEILQEACKNVELKYYSPHTYRHSCAYYALLSCSNGLELKAISQHFGHSEITVILKHYANLIKGKIKEILSQIDFKIKTNYEIIPLEEKIKRLTPANKKSVDVLVNQLLENQKLEDNFV